MASIEKAFIDSIILSRKVMEDSEVNSIIQEYFDAKIDSHKALFNMMELAVERVEKLKMLNKTAEAFKSGRTHADVRGSFVNHDARCNETHIRGMQIVKDSTMDNAMAIPALEAIFSNANPEDYLNQVLAVAVHQAWVLQKIEASLKLQ